MRSRRSPFLTFFAALALVPGLAACGGGDAESIESIIDKNGSSVSETYPDGKTAISQVEAQKAADADNEVAQRALKRRQELAKLEEDQRKETERVMREGVPGGNDEDAEIPIGSADPEVERFRARLAGVCAGGQKRILKVSTDAEKAAKSKDPMEILKAAQAYSGALDSFLNALEGLQPPAGIRDEYADFRGTINALSSNVRLQLISYSDAKRSERLQARTQRLTERLVLQSATLGVTCLSATL